MSRTRKRSATNKPAKPSTRSSPTSRSYVAYRVVFPRQTDGRPRAKSDVRTQRAVARLDARASVRSAIRTFASGDLGPAPDTLVCVRRTLRRKALFATGGVRKVDPAKPGKPGPFSTVKCRR